MTTAGVSDVVAFRRSLRRAAPQLTRPLPWIDHPSAWAVLVSEVMLQQTQTSRVVEPWRQFIQRFPTARVCADASLAEVLTAWRGLGYNRRAKSLRAAAIVIRDDFDGDVPSDVEHLLTLPGVGEYTANAVASFAFGASVAVLDTNVGRVLARAVANRRLRPSEARVLAAEVLPSRHVASFNQAMIDLGAQFCRSSPRCDVCPLRRVCAWQRDGGDDPAIRSAGVSQPQSTFIGSNRQLRGQVLNALRDGSKSLRELDTTFHEVASERRDAVLESLVNDGLIVVDRRRYTLAPS